MAEENCWLTVLDLSAEDFETCIEIRINGEEFLLFRVAGKLYAIQRWCPHMQADLKLGRLIGETIKCGRHGMIFSLKDGRGINCHPFKAKAYEVQVDGQSVKVRLEENEGNKENNEGGTIDARR